MGTPQILLFVLWATGLTASLFMHGKTARVSFWGWLSGLLLTTSLLYWGGFFS